MDENSVMKTSGLSAFKEIAVLSEEHGIVLVERILTGKKYIRKSADIHSRNVYEQLRRTPVSGVPRPYEVCVSEGELTVIEEYIPGKTLNDLLEKDGPLPEHKVIDIAMKLCDILIRLHDLKPPVIHRDIKPSNVMLTDDGSLFLIDLDAAKQAEKSSSRDTRLIGTAGFAAPEQYGFASSNQQTDLYGLGMLMLSLLTNGNDKSMIPKKGIGRILRKCLAIDPKRRYASAASLKRALYLYQHSAGKKFLIALAVIMILIAAGIVLKKERDYQAYLDSTTRVYTAHEAIDPALFAEHPTPVGAYLSDEGSLLVLDEGGLAYYYSNLVSLTEPQCPWGLQGNELTISLEKPQISITAVISEPDYSVLDFSGSLAAFEGDASGTLSDSMLFHKISLDPGEYILSPPPHEHPHIAVREDGVMHFDLGSFHFFIPKRLNDLGPAEGMPEDNCLSFIGLKAGSDFTSMFLFYDDSGHDGMDLDKDFVSVAGEFASHFLDHLQTGYTEEITLAGQKAYKIAISGIPDAGNDYLGKQIHTGYVVLASDPVTDDTIQILFFQTAGQEVNDENAFDSILDTALLKKDM